MSGEALTLILGGVSGAGKSTVGRILASRWRIPFLEGDSLHALAAVAKMSAGEPLGDADRAPWLTAIGERIDSWRKAGEGGVVACSALKRAYRDALRVGRPALWIVMLTAPACELEGRLKTRHGHFMPASLLPSQLQDLEAVGRDEERAFERPSAGRPEETANEIEAELRARGADVPPS